MDRLDALKVWLSRALPGIRVSLEPASSDASFRRYFRARDGERSWIIMDAPPEHEDCRPFVKVAQLLNEAGLHAPKVLAQDLGAGFLLLTDLGNATFLQAIERDRTLAPGLFDSATTALVSWQLASRPDVLPSYDEALLRRELALFPDWYLARHHRLESTAELAGMLEGVFATLLRNILAQPRVYVHRDYMPRNLMVSDPNPGILDFQDAVHGPITYDVASLMRDAFISWEEREILDWTIRYWEKARRARLPVSADFGEFYRDVEWMGMQRHLKVLGIFARLNYRDGKRGYLEDTPRFLRYVRSTALRYGELAGLLPLLDTIEERAPQAGYTF
ncbi:MAG: phosphotransferase [Betaproteobacteria bacterium]|nr:phosphotransferase [Betaproteobacteria bacterium]